MRGSATICSGSPGARWSRKKVAVRTRARRTSAAAPRRRTSEPSVERSRRPSAASFAIHLVRDPPLPDVEEGRQGVGPHLAQPQARRVGLVLLPEEGVGLLLVEDLLHAELGR